MYIACVVEKELRKVLCHSEFILLLSEIFVLHFFYSHFFPFQIRVLMSRTTFSSFLIPYVIPYKTMSVQYDVSHKWSRNCSLFQNSLGHIPRFLAVLLFFNYLMFSVVSCVSLFVYFSFFFWP